MSKNEFLRKLRKRLDVLEDTEIDDIISEYEGYIEEKVNAGLTEEEAVKELGELDLIVKEMLAAYKVKEKKEEVNTDFLTRITNKISDFVDSFDNKSSKDIIKIIIEIALIMIIIGIIRLPFSLIKNLGENLFLDLGSPIGSIFADIWEFIIDLSYTVIAVIFFVKMLDKRLFKKVANNIVEKDEEEKEEKDKEYNNKSKEIVENTNDAQDTHDTINQICDGLFKAFWIFVSFFLVCFLIGITIIFALMIYLLINGVKYYGILLLVLSLFLGGAFFLEVAINFICKRKMKSWVILTRLFIIIVLMGTGLTIGAIEIANTEIIYDYAKTDIKTITRNIEMKNTLMIYNYDEIKIDNTLNDMVRIEYKYPDFKDNLKVEIEIDKCGYNAVCLEEDIENFSWNKDLFKLFINSLKKKKIYVNNFKIYKTIYVSEENYKILTDNKNYDNQDSYNVSFIKTYNVLKVTESNDERYVYLTLRRFQDEDVETVKVSKDLASSVEANKNYEFTFNVDLNLLSDDFEQDDIEDIFRETQLVNISYTDKLGLDQIQENVYKDRFRE